MRTRHNLEFSLQLGLPPEFWNTAWFSTTFKKSFVNAIISTVILVFLYCFLLRIDVLEIKEMDDGKEIWYIFFDPLTNRTATIKLAMSI